MIWSASAMILGPNPISRSRISLSWFDSMLSRSSSSLIFSSDGLGLALGSAIPAIWRLRQFSSALGAVV